MKPACRAQREVMVEHLLGELEGLAATRLEAHLDNCADCTGVYDRLADGFEAARSFEPAVEDEALDRWSGRLEPFLEEPERPARFSGFGFWGWAMGAAAAAVVLAMVGLPTTSDPRPEAPAPLAALSPPAQPAPPPAPAAPSAPVERRALSEHLRAVTSQDFAGRVRQPSPKVTELELESGFAILDFEGGEQRILRVEAPDVKVRVLGTRFFVEASRGAATSVGVISGRIEVQSRGQVEILGAGQVRAYDGSGAYTPDRENLRSAQHHEDGFLDEPAAAPAPEVARAPAKVRPAPAAPAPAPRPDAVAALTRAERLVREGRPDRALLLYEALLGEDLRPEVRDLVRYERARVWGFAQGKHPRADRAFERLAEQATGEVRRQAKLARCELAVRRDACAGRRCLEALRSESGYRAEVQALLRAWDVSGDTCGDHKNDAASRPTK